FGPGIRLHEHDIDAIRYPAGRVRWRVWVGPGHLLKFDPFLIAPVRQLPRDYDVALALAFTGQLLEMPEAEANRVFACHRAALQPFQTGEEACSGPHWPTLRSTGND